MREPVQTLWRGSPEGWECLGLVPKDIKPRHIKGQREKGYELELRTTYQASDGSTQMVTTSEGELASDRKSVVKAKGKALHMMGF